LTLASNVVVQGVSAASVLQKIPDLSATAIIADGVSNCGICGPLTIDMNASTPADGSGCAAITLSTTSVAINNLSVSFVNFIGGLIRPYIDVRNNKVCSNLFFTDNSFTSQSYLIPKPPNANQTGVGVRFLGSVGCTNIKVSRNQSKYTGMMLQLLYLPGSTPSYGFYTNVEFCDNVISSVLDDPNIGTSPIEIYFSDNVTVTGNKIDSGGRGLCAISVRNGVYSNNSISNQTVYFMEMRASDGITISNNVCRNCKQFVYDDTLATDTYASRNIVINGNVIEGGNLGIAGYNDNVNGYMIYMIPTAAVGYQNWEISNNLFIDNVYTGSVTGSAGAGALINITGAATKQIRIIDNMVIQTDDKCGTIFVNCAGDYLTIERNTFFRTADVSNNSYIGSSSYAIIATGTTATNLKISDNLISFSGNDTRTGGTGIIGIGGNVGATPLTGLRVERNRVIGNYFRPFMLNYTNNDVFYIDNDSRGATGIDLVNAGIVFKRTKRIFESTSAPAVGAWIAGDKVINSTPAVGQPKGWICTVAGTPGTWVSEGNL
jgi:hypothetical protein